MLTRLGEGRIWSEESHVAKMCFKNATNALAEYRANKECSRREQSFQGLPQPGLTRRARLSGTALSTPPCFPKLAHQLVFSGAARGEKRIKLRGGLTQGGQRTS